MAQSDMEQAGYSVGYGLDIGRGRVYGMAGAGVALVVCAYIVGSPLLLFIGIAGLGLAYYFYPLVETSRPRIGANQYGVFVDGLGLIAWRGISEIKLVSIAVRTIMTHELQIHLSQPLQKALVADWRKLPWYRQMMHLPWQMSHDNVIRIPMTAFAKPAEEIHRQIERLWRFYKGRG